MAMFIGESLVGEGNEVAHIDLLIGDKEGPVGHAFAAALADQKKGHTNLLAVIAPNLPCKPYAVMIPKFTMEGMKQVIHMFGPAQYAVGKAVADAVAEGILPAADAEKHVIIVGVFIHKDAKDEKKIFQYNYDAVKEALSRALKSEPSVAEITAKKDTAKHPFSGV